ncbi:unnamed protein product [Adineta steineri]|uniref:Uncharacterized protein n=1 Tax=Adineta steineri TaxID=433720 RepID=A0A815P0U2_9BILA|nr:unnamed protein product [Adineta steineri]CAF0770541.1 unnamed protein product [Adineta steineri]CAF1442226.1 unnamed protein product [Adineta steineri]CAF3538987.1 unnamed protein product [Adineta steineri]CAF3598122.1 unnamed protein product [Adineta steineri]
MARVKLISLSRIWYTIIVVLIHLILVYYGIKQCYFNDRLLWPKSSPSPKFELLVQKICLLISLVLLFIFIYPSLCRIGNYSNDNRKITTADLKKSYIDIFSLLWQHCFSLSSTLHLIMSFLIIISTVLIHAKQIMVGVKDSALLWRTDFDLLFNWSSSTSITMSMSKRLTTSNINSSSIPFSFDSYSRLSLLNFLFASFICILREPHVFWSISKLFSIIYSFAIALNVLQWCLMYGALQLLLKNLCYNTIESRNNIGYLLSNQPYTTFFLYLLLEFLIYISSITFYYYAYNRFKSSSNYERCSNYCPSLIGIIILLLYTACKMPLVHDIFLLYIQTRLRLLFITFIYEIIHILLILALWIYLTTKLNWNINSQENSSSRFYHGLKVQNNPMQTISLPELNKDKSYEKVRIFQSEIYYHNRPKNWSLPLNQQSSIMATFDNDDDIITRSPSYPITQNNNNNEIQYRNAIRKTLSSINNSHPQPKAVFLRSNTPPIPPVKKFTKEQVDAARLRAQQMVYQQQRALDYTQQQQRHSAALLISQV